MSDDLQVFISDEIVEHFSAFSFSVSIDQVGEPFGFTVPFFPDKPEYRELYRPCKFRPVRIELNGDLKYTGEIQMLQPVLAEDKSTVQVSGRSKPSTIIDTTFEKDDCPLQFSQKNLQQIANVVLQKHSFGATFEGALGAIFEEAGAESPTETKLSFLHNLAEQRKFLMSQTASGDLLFRRAKTTGAPVATIVEGDGGRITIARATYDDSKRFSLFDVFGQEPGTPDNFARIIDKSLSGKYRPKSVQSNDTNAANITEAAKWIAAASVADAIKIPFDVDGWTDDNDEILKAKKELTEEL
jgi:prophage tail gpP-like protein